MDSEHLIQQKIQLYITQNNLGCCFRANVGSVKQADGRWFSTGLPNGYPDLHGTRWIDNQSYFIEVKSPTGKIRDDQMRFHQFLMQHKVIHGIARSVDDAKMIIQGGLVGYGYPDMEIE